MPLAATDSFFGASAVTPDPDTNLVGTECRGLDIRERSIDSFFVASSVPNP